MRRLLSGLLRLELAVYADVGILVESGIAFEARFRLGTASEDPEIVLEEADLPLNGGVGMVMFECVGLALSFFDELTVGNTGSRPGLRKMVSIDLVNGSVSMPSADNDMFFVFLAFFEGIYLAGIAVDASGEDTITHSASVGCGNV